MGERPPADGGGPSAPAALLDDMDLALRSELGARTLYPLLRRLTRDAELRRVLERLASDQRGQVEQMRALMAGLGARPRRRSFRRWVAAWLVAAGTLIAGQRFALRLCLDAEESVGRWYGAYRAWFLQQGDVENARTCEGLALTKTRHAAWLSTWVQNVPFRRR